MNDPDTQVPGYRCARCGHVWVPLNKDKRPKVCPKCKSPYWDTPRKETKIVKCEVCGKERRKDPSAIARTDHHFCSWVCYAEWRKGRFTGPDHWNYSKVTEPCVICGYPVARLQKETRDHPNPVCSRECWRELRSRQTRGENHPMWRGGSFPYYGDDWEWANRQTRKRDKNTCQRCGRKWKKGERLFDVHHIKPRREGGTNDLDNLILLCGSCHLTVEWEYQLAQGERRISLRTST